MKIKRGEVNILFFTINQFKKGNLGVTELMKLIKLKEELKTIGIETENMIKSAKDEVGDDVSKFNNLISKFVEEKVDMSDDLFNFMTNEQFESCLDENMKVEAIEVAMRFLLK